MSDMISTDEFLQRIEQMLDALQSLGHSSSDFKAASDDLQTYLKEGSEFFTNGHNLTENDRNRVAVIIDRLSGLQRSAETKASIPAELQKYIAERLD